MAKFKISGVWKDSSGTITHYAFHTVNPTSVSRGTKTAKPEAVRILSIPNNEAVTWLWDYKSCFWKDGEKVEIVNGSFLRSKPDGTVRDNLVHLIDYDWL